MNRLNQPVSLQQVQLRPTLSIGIAQRDAAKMSAPELLGRAVSAMMSARHQGKNQILFFDPLLTERAQRRLTQEHDILQGLEQEQFALFYSRRSIWPMASWSALKRCCACVSPTAATACRKN